VIQRKEGRMVVATILGDTIWSRLGKRYKPDIDINSGPFNNTKKTPHHARTYIYI